MPIPTTHLVRSADGTEIYADAVGDPARPAIVFIHGFSLSALVFDPIFADPEWLENAYLVRPRLGAAVPFLISCCDIETIVCVPLVVVV